MSKKIDTGGPAFPFEYHNKTGTRQPGFFDTGILPPGASQQFAGLSLRDYFAAKAMQALVHEQHTAEMITVMAMTAYDYADAMLEARQ